MPPVHKVRFLDAAGGSPDPIADSPMDVFSLEDEGEPSPEPLPWEASAEAAHDALAQLRRHLEPDNAQAAMLGQHVALAAGGAHRVEPDALRQLLARLGYSAKLHEVAVPFVSNKLRVRHQYLSVCLPNTGSTGLAAYVVEPNFRDCFCVAHPTPRYAAVVDGLPPAVVASRAAFHRIVSVLCREMALSFAQGGEDLPPWRTAQALLSRWHLSGGAAPGPAPAGDLPWAGATAQGGDLFAAKRAALGAD